MKLNLELSEMSKGKLSEALKSVYGPIIHKGDQVWSNLVYYKWSNILKKEHVTGIVKVHIGCWKCTRGSALQLFVLSMTAIGKNDQKKK